MGRVGSHVGAWRAAAELTAGRGVGRPRLRIQNEGRERPPGARPRCDGGGSPRRPVAGVRQARLP